MMAGRQGVLHRSVDPGSHPCLDGDPPTYESIGGVQKWAHTQCAPLHLPITAPTRELLAAWLSAPNPPHGLLLLLSLPDGFYAMLCYAMHTVADAALLRCRACIAAFNRLPYQLRMRLESECC